MNIESAFLISVIVLLLIVIGVLFLKLAALTRIIQQRKIDIEYVFEMSIADGVLTQNEKERIRRIAEERSMDSDKIIFDLEEKLLKRKIKAETEPIDYRKKNGTDFEKYVIQKFDRNCFRIKEWAGDKFINGIYAETTPNPDILLEFHFRNETCVLAVECKWKQKAFYSRVEVTEQKQFDKYKEFEAKKMIPVYIVLGIGGEASDPEKLYCIPLSILDGPSMMFNILKKYRKSKERNFFYNIDTGLLS